ncbi:7627_t:CDS:2, partial [Paraglomus occultum]
DSNTSVNKNVTRKFSATECPSVNHIFIEFDRDDEYFATAGVTKKIIFDYVVCPGIPTSKTQIASADYDDVVTLWDALIGEPVSVFEEHETRAWSVDFCRMDPTKLISGSDDTK